MRFKAFSALELQRTLGFDIHYTGRTLRQDQWSIPDFDIFSDKV
jgi:hypothetical protein